MQHRQPLTPVKMANNRHENSDTFHITTKKIQNYIYNYNDLLGQGNFSKVYKGINQHNNQKVAVKIVELSSITSAKLEELLNSEIQILKTLKHENVVQCFQVLSSQRNCYIITQLCDGDLSSVVSKKSKNCFQQFQIYKLAWDIFQGLKYLAERKIVHRDLKISNIFMKGDQAKIADFGFAKYANGLFFDAGIGSPVYMSPQGLLYNTYGPKTDIWAFGIILFQLTHGRTPASHCRTEQQLKSVVNRQIGLKDLKGQLTNEFKELVIKCLDTNQSSRITVYQISQTRWMRNVQRQLNYDCIRTRKTSSNIEGPLLQNSSGSIGSYKHNQTQFFKRNSVQSIQQNICIFPKTVKHWLKIPNNLCGNQNRNNKSVNLQNKQNYYQQRSVQQQNFNIVVKQVSRNANQSPSKIYRPSQNLLKLIQNDKVRDYLNHLQPKRGSYRVTSVPSQNQKINDDSALLVKNYQIKKPFNTYNAQSKQRPKSSNPEGGYPLDKQIDQIKIDFHNTNKAAWYNLKFSDKENQILKQEKLQPNKNFLDQNAFNFQQKSINEHRNRTNSSLMDRQHKKEGINNVKYEYVDKKGHQLKKNAESYMKKINYTLTKICYDIPQLINKEEQIIAEPTHKSIVSEKQAQVINYKQQQSLQHAKSDYLQKLDQQLQSKEIRIETKILLNTHDKSSTLKNVNEKHFKVQQLKFTQDKALQKRKTKIIQSKKSDINFTVQNNERQSKTQTTFKPQAIFIKKRILPGIIEFAECIGVLHYCRLLFKYLSLRKQVQLESQFIKNRDNKCLVKILIKILCQLTQKIINQQIKYSKHRSTKQYKIKSVIEEYMSRYIRQLQLNEKQLNHFFDDKQQQCTDEILFWQIKKVLEKDQSQIYEDIMISSSTEPLKPKQGIVENNQQRLSKVLNLGYFCIILIPNSQKIQACSDFSQASIVQSKNPHFSHFQKSTLLQQVMEMDKSERTLEKYLRLRRNVFKATVENQLNRNSKHQRSQAAILEKLNSYRQQEHSIKNQFQNRLQANKNQLKNKSAISSTPQPCPKKESQTDIFNNQSLNITDNTSFFKDINYTGECSKYEFFSNTLNKIESFNYRNNTGQTPESLMNTLTSGFRTNPKPVGEGMQRKPSQRYAGYKTLENVNTIYKMR